MRWPLAFVLSVSLVGALVGCRGNNKCGQVESELRAREEDVRHLKGELDRAEFYNQSLSRELAAVRGDPGPGGMIEKPSERYPVRTLRLGRGTAGRPADCGGDDALQVQVEPVDCEGQTIKAPGCLYIEAVEITKEGLKRPLSSWEVSREELSRKWQNGLFNTGYMLTFPWKTPPLTEKLRILARFTIVDGRVFEADKDITVRLLPEHARRPSLTAPETELPVPSPAPGLPPGAVVPAIPGPDSPMPPTPGVPVVPPGGPAVIPPGGTLPGPTEVLPAPSAPPSVIPEVIPKSPNKPQGTPASTDGPRLIQGNVPRSPKVQLLRPVRMPLDP
ncbi:MAG: hypothetical protein U0840_28125 [Gemmataceae bacterium]